jgi:hypothetical protein
MTADDHGSASTYSNHGCRCDLCRGAWTDYLYEVRRTRTLRLQKDPSLATHGKYTTYTNWGCRCDLCRAAHTARQKAARA